MGMGREIDGVVCFGTGLFDGELFADFLATGAACGYLGAMPLINIQALLILHRDDALNHRFEDWVGRFEVCLLYIPAFLSLTVKELGSHRRSGPKTLVGFCWSTPAVSNKGRQERK